MRTINSPGLGRSREAGGAAGGDVGGAVGALVVVAGDGFLAAFFVGAGFGEAFFLAMLIASLGDVAAVDQGEGLLMSLPGLAGAIQAKARDGGGTLALELLPQEGRMASAAGLAAGAFADGVAHAAGVGVAACIGLAASSCPVGHHLNFPFDKRLWQSQNPCPS